MYVFLSRHQCGFRKGYSTQQCLFAITEKLKSDVDNKKTFGALQSWLKHLITFRMNFLQSCVLMDSGFLRKDLTYLFSRKQKTKTNSHGKKFYSEYRKDLF